MKIAILVGGILAIVGLPYVLKKIWPHPQHVASSPKFFEEFDRDLPLDQLSLRTSEGTPLTPEIWRRGWHLVFFGYTNCPDVCPMTLGLMKKILLRSENLPGLAGQIFGVFVSVDPDRDTLENIRAYATHFHERISAVSGTEEELIAFAKFFGTGFKRDPSRPEILSHSGSLYLVGPDGRWRGVFSQPNNADAICQQLQSMI